LLFCCFCTTPATTEIYTLSLHDALPICRPWAAAASRVPPQVSSTSSRWAAMARTSTVWVGELMVMNSWRARFQAGEPGVAAIQRSEEHTSELQSRENLVCRLLLEKKNKR